MLSRATMHVKVIVHSAIEAYSRLSKRFLSVIIIAKLPLERLSGASFSCSWACSTASLAANHHGHRTSYSACPCMWWCTGHLSCPRDDLWRPCCSSCIVLVRSLLRWSLCKQSSSPIHQLRDWVPKLIVELIALWTLIVLWRLRPNPVGSWLPSQVACTKVTLILISKIRLIGSRVSYVSLFKCIKIIWLNLL